MKWNNSNNEKKKNIDANWVFEKDIRSNEQANIQINERISQNAYECHFRVALKYHFPIETHRPSIIKIRKVRLFTLSSIHYHILAHFTISTSTTIHHTHQSTSTNYPSLCTERRENCLCPLVAAVLVICMKLYYVHIFGTGFTHSAWP